MAQGVGSILGGPVAAMLHQSTGSWIPVFAVIITMDFLTAGLALAVLKPMRRRWLQTFRPERVVIAVEKTA
jgi:OFA family oxalate/formate antiporter-like MFS transporter